MSQLQDRIAQFRKMAADDPDNELGHYRLGQLLAEAGQHEEAVASFRRTLQINPDFSKVYQLLAESLIQLGQREEAVQTLRQGHRIASERGDNLPRDAMSRMLVQLGEPEPVTLGTPAAGAGLGGGFRCQRPGCMWGARATQLPAPPMKDDLGQKIYQQVCAACWQDWLRNFSIKVINELRLDLSTERGQEEYDRYMREFLGLD
jgi:tetratricopeptide (TPR) repeat protein